MKSSKPINIKSLFVYNVIALGIVAVLSVSHFVLTNELIRNELFDVEVINVASRQRMLSQQLTREALLLLQSERPDEQKIYRDSIKDLMRAWIRPHEAMEQGHWLDRPITREHPALSTTFGKVDLYFHGLEGTLKEIIELPEGPSGLAPASPALTDSLIAQSDNFLVWIDQAVRQVESTALGHLSDLKRNLFITWASVLLLVVLETAYLLFPVRTRVQKFQAELEDTVDLLQSDLDRDKEALWRSEQFKSAILANSSEGIVTMDDRGRVVEINQAIEDIFGYGPKDAIGRAVAELFIPHDMRKQHAEGVQAYLRTGQGPLVGKKIEVPALRKDGSLIHVEMVVDGHQYKGRYFFTSFLRDITERKNSEAELMRLSTALEHVAESIIITDPEDIIQYVNSGFERNTGYTREEVIGSKQDQLGCGRQDPAVRAEMWDTIAAGKTWFGISCNKRKDGSSFEEEATVSPIFDDEGRIINYIAVKRDVTEERSKEAQLRQAQKMEAMGVLSGGIAHDFNNILTPILGFTEIAKRTLPEDSKVQAHLDAIHRGAMRAKDLVGQILLFGRKDSSEQSEIQLTPLTKELVKLLHSVIPRTIHIEANLEPELPPVVADGTQIHTLLMNLCINASHAMPEGGVLSIELNKAALSGETMHDGNKISGEFVRLAIGDTGHGMDKHILERIFDPFFTTKESGKGTGLGLSMVYGVVKNHNGHIAVKSTPGEGSLFEIYLPYKKSNGVHIPSPPSDSLLHGTERILFIDDEEEIVSSIQFGLMRYGYHVTGFCNPEKALEHLRLFPENFDLVITDRIMPVLTGEKVATAVMQLAPEMPIILCTGNSEGLSPEILERLRIACVLNKPYSPPEMCETIRGVMGQAGTSSPGVLGAPASPGGQADSPPVPDDSKGVAS